MPTPNDQPTVATLRYFEVPTCCSNCQRPSRVSMVVRLTRTMDDNFVVTMLCTRCAQAEVRTVLAKGEMVRSADGMFLVAPFLGNIAEAMTSHVAEAQGGSATEASCCVAEAAICDGYQGNVAVGP